MTGGPDALTDGERADLLRAENEIEQHEKEHLRIGWPLRTIRDERLFRETHRAWGAYTRERWGMTKQSADRFIKAVEIVEELEAAGLPAPTYERQARPLSRLTPEQRREGAGRVEELDGFAGVKAKRIEAIAEDVAPKKGTEVAVRPTEMVLVTTGVGVGPSRQAKDWILRDLEKMAALADSIQALGPHAVEDAVRLWNVEESNGARDAVMRTHRLLRRVSRAWKRHRGGQLEEGQQAMPFEV